MNIHINEEIYADSIFGGEDVDDLNRINIKQSGDNYAELLRAAYTDEVQQQCPNATIHVDVRFVPGTEGYNPGVEVNFDNIDCCSTI